MQRKSLSQFCKIITVVSKIKQIVVQNMYSVSKIGYFMSIHYVVGIVIDIITLFRYSAMQANAEL